MRRPSGKKKNSAVQRCTSGAHCRGRAPHRLFHCQPGADKDRALRLCQGTRKLLSAGKLGRWTHRPCPVAVNQLDEEDWGVRCPIGGAQRCPWDLVFVKTSHPRFINKTRAPSWNGSIVEEKGGAKDPMVLPPLVHRS